MWIISNNSNNLFHLSPENQFLEIIFCRILIYSVRVIMSNLLGFHKTCLCSSCNFQIMSLLSMFLKSFYFHINKLKIYTNIHSASTAATLIIYGFSKRDIISQRFLIFHLKKKATWWALLFLDTDQLAAQLFSSCAVQRKLLKGNFQASHRWLK